MGINRSINAWSSSLPRPELVPQYRGEWVAAPYEVADVVNYKNSLYISIAPTSATDDPQSSKVWEHIIDGQIINDAEVVINKTNLKLQSIDETLDVANKAISDIETVKEDVLQTTSNALQENTLIVKQVLDSVDIGRVANQDELVGKPKGTYDLIATKERLLWDGNIIVPGSKGKVYADVDDVTNVKNRIPSVDAQYFGILPNGKDMSAKLAEAINAGEHIIFSVPGDYTFDNGLNKLAFGNLRYNFNMVPGAKLLFLDPSEEGIRIEGPEFIELSLNTVYKTLPTTRVENKHAILITDAVNCRFPYLSSIGSPAIGAMIYRPLRSHFGVLSASKTMADGVHFHNAVDCSVQLSWTDDTGDDGFAAHGKPNDIRDMNRLVVDKVIARNAAASGIASIGGVNLQIGEYLIENTGVHGIRLDSDAAYGGIDRFGYGEARDITIGSGKIVGAGAATKSVTPGAPAHSIFIGAVKGLTKIDTFDSVAPTDNNVHAVNTENLVMGGGTTYKGKIGFFAENVNSIYHSTPLLIKDTLEVGYRTVDCPQLLGAAPEIVNAGSVAAVLVSNSRINFNTVLSVTDTRSDAPGGAKYLSFNGSSGKLFGLQSQLVNGELAIDYGNVKITSQTSANTLGYTKPPFPASGVAFKNTTGGAVMVYVFNGSDASKNVISIFINGTQVSANAGSVKLFPGDTISINYNGTSDPDKTGPGWLWQPT